MKYERLKQKRLENPEWAEQERLKILDNQRKRWLNPEVRRRQREAQAVWRERKRIGLLDRKENAPYTPVAPLVFTPAEFVIHFD